MNVLGSVCGLAVYRQRAGISPPSVVSDSGNEPVHFRLCAKATIGIS